VNDETNGPDPLADDEPRAEGNGSPSSDAPASASDAGEGGEGAAAESPEPEADPLETAQAELARIRDQLLRTAADFDNFRKRSRRELTDAERRGRDDFLRELLPVFDNLERAAVHAESTSDVQSLADGIRLVVRQFHDTLGRLGIERIDAEGTAFDPVTMEAIQQLETAEHPPGTVAAQVQAGYRVGERLIRPAMVVVAKAPAS
jgi:molecular chaperone GrpE